MENELGLILRVDFLKRLKRRIPSLSELLADEELSDFYRFVKSEGLRQRAVEQLDLKLKTPAVVLPFKND